MLVGPLSVDRSVSAGLKQANIQLHLPLQQRAARASGKWLCLQFELTHKLDVPVVLEFAWCEDVCAHSLAEDVVGLIVASFRAELIECGAAAVSALYSLAARPEQAGSVTVLDMRARARCVNCTVA